MDDGGHGAHLSTADRVRLIPPSTGLRRHAEYYRAMRRATLLVLSCCLALGCGAARASDVPLQTATSGTPVLPPPNVGLDYQLGGAYVPPAGVGIVSRDRHDMPAPGIYNVCYVNGFQSQPKEGTFWTTSHPDLILRDAGGNPVIDTEWGEMLLDIRTPASRAALAAIVNAWIAGCASSGFNAVEIDNLDSYSRSTGLLTMDQAVAYMRLLSDAGHAAGLAVAQKNSAELLPRRTEMGTDFAVAEECNRYSECGSYVETYGRAVLVIEYRRVDFTTGCRAYPDLSIVLRDVNLTRRGNAAYVYDGC